MQRIVAIIFSMLFVTACAGGAYKVVGTYDSTRQAFDGVAVQNNDGSNCPSLPSTFQESDLVGTWRTYFNATGTTTITIRADGTYKQIHDYPPTDLHYAGDWQTWKFERRDDGPSYVHFDKMLVCGQTCGHAIGGTWYDPCGQQMLTEKENEVVLLLKGVQTGQLTGKYAVPQGVEMYEPILDPDSLPTVYQLER